MDCLVVVPFPKVSEAIVDSCSGGEVDVPVLFLSSTWVRDEDERRRGREMTLDGFASVCAEDRYSFIVLPDTVRPCVCHEPVPDRHGSIV